MASTVLLYPGYMFYCKFGNTEPQNIEITEFDRAARFYLKSGQVMSKAGQVLCQKVLICKLCNIYVCAELMCDLLFAMFASTIWL